MLSFEEAADLLDQIAEPFPVVLFEGLNGGVNLQPDARTDPEFPEEDVYILGEYCDDLLGRYINLYYGSFAALAQSEGWSLEDWQRELRETFSHELTHHMEGRAGLHALDDQDAAELAAWRKEFRLSEGSTP